MLAPNSVEKKRRRKRRKERESKGEGQIEKHHVKKKTRCRHRGAVAAAVETARSGGWPLLTVTQPRCEKSRLGSLQAL